MALLSQSKPGRLGKGRRRNGGSFTVSHMAALAVIATLGIIGFTWSVFNRQDSTPGGIRIHRRSLHSNQAADLGSRGSGLSLRGSGQIVRGEILGQSPDALRAGNQHTLPGFKHSLAVLTSEGAAGRPVWDAKQLQTAAEEWLFPVAVTWYSPLESAALSGVAGVASLPAVVYHKPHCIPATCGPSPALELRTVKGAEVTNVTMDLSSPPATSLEAVVKWLRSQAPRPQLYLANDHPTKSFLFRHVRNPEKPDEGTPHGQYTRKPSDRGWIETPIGANWVVTDADATTPAPILKRLKVKGDDMLVMHADDDCNLLVDKNCVLPIKSTPFSAAVNKTRKANLAKNLNDIIVQKKETRTYTKAGYEKTRAPPLIYAILKDFYDNHNTSTVNEWWTDDNIYVNHEASRFQILELPETGTTKPTLYELIRPLFEKWSGIASLQPSAIYGIRLYSANAVLQDHVDRPDTHIISAIVNVAQDLEEDWPLEIVGHNMKTSHVVMKPGDMVLYEGASCAHGRPTPLKGRFMANVFFHMAPTDDAKPFNPR